MPAARRVSKAADQAVEKADNAVSKAASKTEKTVAKAEKTTKSTATAAAKKTRKQLLPVAAQFPLATVLSFAMASLGYSLLGEFTGSELAAVSRNQESWQEVGVLAGWRVFELALGWFGNLDSLDVATMDLLSHGPALYLQSTFYRLSPATAFGALLIDVLSAAVPFYLLRPLSAVHTGAGKLPNRELVDLPLQLYTTALSTCIYTVTLVLSLRFLLPRILVVYFSGLPSVEPARTASYAAVLPVTLLFGAAASTFIYAPFATTGKAKEDDEIRRFNPVEATLGQTVRWNFWGYTAKTKVVICRTAATMLLTGVNTYLACTKTIYGIESTGALVYAGVWVFAASCTGFGLHLVGGD